MFIPKGEQRFQGYMNIKWQPLCSVNTMWVQLAPWSLQLELLIFSKTPHQPIGCGEPDLLIWFLSACLLGSTLLLVFLLYPNCKFLMMTMN